MINKFSPVVSEKLNYYVYRLIDPRNGNTFYVGKGHGDRVFRHAACALGYTEKDSEEYEENKLKTISAIMDEGLEVIHIIQRWNLSEKEAFEVEAALIDCYQGLLNIQRGHHSDDYGVINTEMLIRNLSCKVYDEPDDFRYLIIKVGKWRVDELAMYGKNARYEATRWRWRINPKSVEEYPYVFSVTDGIVKEVYKIDKWIKSEDSDRYEFVGGVAEEMRGRFIGTRIPEAYRKKGMASPVLFSKNKIIKK